MTRLVWVSIAHSEIVRSSSGGCARSIGISKIAEDGRGAACSGSPSLPLASRTAYADTCGDGTPSGRDNAAPMPPLVAIDVRDAAGSELRGWGRYARELARSLHGGTDQGFELLALTDG